MKNKFFVLLSLLAVVHGTFAQKARKTAPAKLTKYVDQLIGTGFHGHVFVGANVPFGAVQLGPTQLSQGWDWCSGYHISDSTIVGFQHTHLSGTGIGDLGDISLMPTNGPVILNKGTIKDMKSGYVSLFDHKDEVIRPGYYGVKLKRYNIDIALTASKRVGMHRYTYPSNTEAHLLIDFAEGIADRPTETYLTQVDANTIQGYRFSRGWATAQRIYFTAVFPSQLKR